MSSIRRPKPTTVVLGLLCVMYLITYVDRVNISTAADSIKRELSLSNTVVTRNSISASPGIAVEMTVVCTNNAVSNGRGAAFAMRTSPYCLSMKI